MTTTVDQLADAIRALLPFQFEHLGYGTYRCRSCGSYATMDAEEGKQRREGCSPSCPWQVARNAVGEP